MWRLEDGLEETMGLSGAAFPSLLAWSGLGQCYLGGSVVGGSCLLTAGVVTASEQEYRKETRMMKGREEM